MFLTFPCLPGVEQNLLTFQTLSFYSEEQETGKKLQEVFTKSHFKILEIWNYIHLI